MSSAQTPRYQEKREAILAAAARLFNDEGVRGATLGGIAAGVGLATNSVTYYYRKKEDLATACFQRSIAVFDGLAEQAGGLPDVPARVRDFLRRLAQLLADVEEGRRPAIVNFNDIRALPSPQAEQVYAAYTDMFRRVRGLLKGAGTAELSRDDFNARGHILISVAHWMRSWIGRHEPEEYARAADRVADVLLRGLAAPGSAWNSADAGSAWRRFRRYRRPGLDGGCQALSGACGRTGDEQEYREDERGAPVGHALLRRA